MIPFNLAPEILNGEKASFESDIFSLGVILYFMLSGALPFDDPFPMEIISKTEKCEVTFLEDVW